MMKYAFYVTISQIGCEEKGDTQKDIRIDKQKNHIGHTVIPTGIETTHLIGLGFSYDGKINILILITLFIPTIVF